jgi:hypothetical protein
MRPNKPRQETHRDNRQGEQKETQLRDQKSGEKS